ncbi:MAG: Ig-like domain-containing protein, partial [Polyangiales bacterium]
MRVARIVGLCLSVGWAVTLGCGSSDGAGGAGGTAGSGGGGGTLRLVQTVPADLASEVPTEIVVTAEFDSPLNEATVTTSSFSLRRGDGAEVDGSVTVAGKATSFTAGRALGILSTYAATVTTAIEDVEGNTLDMSRTWQFTTREGQWGVAALVETDANDVGPPEIALDSNGSAVAIWGQSDGIRSNIWANRFTPTTGWGVAALIEVNNAGSAGSPQVALEPNGTAVAVWSQSDGTRTNIWANRFTPTGGWGAAGLVETDNLGAAVGPHVGLDSSGNAIAIWSQSDGTRDNIWANRFTPAGGWGGAELVETDPGAAAFPQVALDSTGDAIAVWYQSDGTRDNIWANRFTPTTGWGVAELIETDPGDVI